jgi:hypothetical protein
MYKLMYIIYTYIEILFSLYRDRDIEVYSWRGSKSLENQKKNKKIFHILSYHLHKVEVLYYYINKYV